MPTEFAVNPEHVLLQLKKNKQEPLLFFVRRFKAVVDDFNEVNEQRKEQIILQHLLVDIKIILSSLDIKASSLDSVLNIVRTHTD